MPPGLEGLRFCTLLGGIASVAASPNMRCDVPIAVEAKVFSRACEKRTRCALAGFTFRTGERAGDDRPFRLTRHATCRKGALPIVIDEARAPRA